MQLRRATALLLCMFLGTGCPEPQEPPHLLYEQDPQSLDNPFPDLRLVGESGMQLRADWYRPFLMPRALTAKLREFFRNYAQSATQIRGVGNFGSTLLRTSEPVDPASLPGTVVRLRKVGEGYEVLEEGVLVNSSRASLDGTGKEGVEGFPEFLVVRPSKILPEGEEGLLVVKRGMTTVGGVPLGRGFSFEREKGSAERIKDAAAALGVKPEEILLTLPLRAEVVREPLSSLAGWTLSAQEPSFSIPAKAIIADEPGTRPVGSWSAGDADWATLQPWLEKNPFATPANKVAKVLLGTFKSRDLRENGVWKQAWVLDPSSAPAKELWFALTVPVGPKPAGGWPVVMGGHGLNNRNTVKFGDPNSFCLELAQWLAASGMACIGLDAPSHGTRGSQLDFFEVEDLARARDNFRQMAFDQLQLSRTIAVIDIDADGSPDLAPEASYFGNSLGGIMGTSFVSFDPRVKVAVLNVPGGGLSNILVSDDIRDRIGLLIVAKTSLAFGSAEYYSAFPIFRTIAQLFLDPGDPVNLVQVLPKEKAVLMQEGVGDRTIPNFTTEDLARAAGIEALDSPLSGATPIRALFRADPANYLPAAQLPGYDGHGVFWSAAPVRNQAIRFLETRGTTFVLE